MLKFNPFPNIQVGISTRIIISTADSKEQTLMKGTDIQMGLTEPMLGGRYPETNNTRKPSPLPPKKR